MKITEIDRIERQQKRIAESKNRILPKREIFGAELSEDFGKTWKLFALCTECLRSLEPPVMMKKGIRAGVKNCDWCECRNTFTK